MVCIAKWSQYSEERRLFFGQRCEGTLEDCDSCSTVIFFCLRGRLRFILTCYYYNYAYLKDFRNILCYVLDKHFIVSFNCYCHYMWHIFYLTKRNVRCKRKIGQLTWLKDFAPFRGINREPMLILWFEIQTFTLKRQSLKKTIKTSTLF